MNSRRSLTLRLAKRDYEPCSDYPEVARPKVRGDCLRSPRPCPFVSCRHHLFLEVLAPVGGRPGLKLNFPTHESWETPETCSLDVADRGGCTLEEVGTILHITRERARQLEEKVVRKVQGRLMAELGAEFYD